jgi:SAM-dependent methyltransferase
MLAVSTIIYVSRRQPVTTERDRIRQTITAHYGARAERAAGDPDLISLEAVGDACCDDGCCVPAEMSEEERAFIKGLYAQDDVAGLPEGAIEAAAGCGNPTALAEIRAGETVLDLGSGGGIDCFLAAKQTGPTGSVIGVDMTPQMIELARRNAAELGVANVEFRLGDIEELPVAAGSVDVIISNCVVNLSTDKERTLKEAFRVLRSGGRFRVSDMVWCESRPEGADSVEEWAGCIAGALTVPDFLACLSAAGFANARADAVRPLSTYEGLASALISAEKP